MKPVTNKEQSSDSATSTLSQTSFADSKCATARNAPVTSPGLCSSPKSRCLEFPKPVTHGAHPPQTNGSSGKHVLGLTHKNTSYHFSLPEVNSDAPSHLKKNKTLVIFLFHWSLE